MYHRYLKENSLNIDSIDTLSSIKELADFLEEGRKVDFDKFVSGLKTLEKYIVKNVYETNVHDLFRLQQLERNLTRWLFQLDAVYVETVGEGLNFGSVEHNTRKDEKLNKLKKTLTNGLDYLRLQISGKKENSNAKQKPNNKKKRQAIPPKIRALLQKEISSRCPFCGNGDVGHFEIHHIDENPGNNSLTNLLMLCPLCHSKITKGDISLEQVLAKKVQVSSAESTEKFEKVEIEASYPGGPRAWNHFIQTGLRYPDKAVKLNVQGTVVVSFVVDEYGRVCDVKAVNGPVELHEAAELVVKSSPRWHAAVQNGRNVKTYKKQPIIFRVR